MKSKKRLIVFILLFAMSFILQINTVRASTYCPSACSNSVTACAEVGDDAQCGCWGSCSSTSCASYTRKQAYTSIRCGDRSQLCAAGKSRDYTGYGYDDCPSGTYCSSGECVSTACPTCQTRDASYNCVGYSGASGSNCCYAGTLTNDGNIGVDGSNRFLCSSGKWYSCDNNCAGDSWCAANNGGWNFITAREPSCSQIGSYYCSWDATTAPGWKTGSRAGAYCGTCKQCNPTCLNSAILTSCYASTDPSKFCDGQGNCANITEFITNSYWENLLGNPITKADVNDTIKIVAICSKCANGEQVDFDIYEKDTLFDDMADKGSFTFQNGKAVSLWKVKWMNDIGGPEYVFKTTLFNKNVVSSILSVKSSQQNNSAPVTNVTFPNYANANNYKFSLNTPISFAQTSYDEDDTITYLWNFGDGNTSTQANPSYSYTTKSGPVHVNLTVTDARGLSAIDEIDILIDDTTKDDTPLAVISSPEEGLITEDYNLLFDVRLSIDDITTFNQLNFSWTFDDGDLSHRQKKGMEGAYFYKNFTTAGPHWAVLELSDGM